ncbi:hypothetical protein LJ707_00015 [Mucilaginibacter sp. UR6-1]|nr:hypothetical protein [Mucilaginibacter sp. UR6-1]
MQPLIVFMLILSACNQKSFVDKREKNMTNNNGYVENGNSAIDIFSKDLNKKTQMLFSNKDIILVGLNNEPYALFASTKFEISSLPPGISNNLFQIKRVLLKSSFLGNQINELQFIEPWLAYFHKVEYLTLDHIKLKNLNVIKSLPLKYLILSDIALENRGEIINEFGNLKTLKYIAHSSLFTPAEIIKIKKDLPDVNILLEADFNRKVEKGEIESD